MYRFLDVMKVSAVGVILLSALAACNSKPESNPTPPESDQVEVIIEQVVDGKVVDTRAVGRTDVVKYTGKTDGSDLVQLKWPGRVSKGEDVEITAYAKPNLYLREIKYRYSQSEEKKSSPTSTNVRGDTYNASRPLTAVNENSPVRVPTNGAYDNRVYISLDFLSHKNGDELIFLPHVTLPGSYEMWKKIKAQAENDVDVFDRYKLSDPGVRYDIVRLIKAMTESKRLEEYYRHRWYDIAFLKDKNARKDAYERAYRAIEANAIEIANIANSEHYSFNSRYNILYIMKRLTIEHPGFCDPTGISTLNEGLMFLTGDGWKANVQNSDAYFGYLPGVYNIYPKKIPDIKSSPGSGGHH